MPKVLRVRRSTINRIFKEPAFRTWLKEQPRSALKHGTKELPVLNQSGTGWTVEDFFLEARKRGIRLGFATAQKWSVGTVPRNLTMPNVVEAFPGVRF